MAVESKLDEIKSQLNNDLIPQLFALNGWSTDVMPFFDYGSINNESLDEVGKFVQRVKAVGALPVTPDVINWILDQAGIDYRVDPTLTTQEITELTGSNESASGSGMTEGLPSGTGSATGASGDASAGNAANAA